ncbi:hypothetical protein [Psychrobacillus sp. BM2]|uniref:hypothetical protein n=1 Tax=Psychrobacillus sp. BM2 TaxID=3400421 RepID=UPI003B01A623
MTEKVKVTQEQADKLKDVLADPEFTHQELLNDQHSEPWATSHKCLNELDVWTLARTIYEVEPQFKVGDWIVITDGNSSIGEIHRISKIGDRSVLLFDHSYSCSWRVSQIRHATSEEIKAGKERRLWNSIGREVGEFRDGDYGEHISKKSSSESREYLEDWYKRGKLKGFYPVESFISFEGEDES